MATVFVATLVSGQAAYALPGDDGYLCMYEDDNYGGQRECRLGTDSSFHNDGFNDKLSSYVNKTGSWWVLYVNVDYGGSKICLKPNSHDGNLGNNTAFEDDISSVDKKGTSAPAGCDVTIGYAN